MSDHINMSGKSVIAPFAAEEGTITMTEVHGVGGNVKAPKLSAPIKKGDLVELADDMTVIKHSTGIAIGWAYANPQDWEVEPKTDYTQAQAISAGLLRDVSVQTFFKAIKTVNAKPSEGIEAGMYVVLKNAVEKSASSGTTATNALALTDQTTDNTVVIGLL